MNSVVLSLSVRRDNIGDPTYIFHVSAHGLIRRDLGKFALLTRVRIIARVRIILLMPKKTERFGKKLIHCG